MDSLTTRTIEHATHGLMAERERLITQCLDNHTPGWLLSGIGRRCEIIIPPKNDCEIVYIDGIPRLKLFKPESKVESDANVYKLVFTLPYQWL